ncbi:hypothetical protein B0H11DRAFT_2240334 [Mycena galericulata]|nr:hypothetical protein B0H11DRAFT_2240334 [Mycena galericulata]
MDRITPVTSDLIADFDVDLHVVDAYTKTTSRSLGLQRKSGGNCKRFHTLGAGYYGEIGYQILDVALRFLFPDDMNLLPFHPLTYDTLLREVLIPEAAQRIVQEDLGLTPPAAKNTLKDSHIFGMIQYPSSSESPDLDEAIRTTTRITERAKSKYRSWVASKTSLGFTEWVAEQAALSIKLEPTEVVLPPREVPGKGRERVFIDLTLDNG